MIPATSPTQQLVVEWKQSGGKHCLSSSAGRAVQLYIWQVQIGDIGQAPHLGHLLWAQH